MTSKTFAFQGAPGAFSHQAARMYAAQIGDEASYLPCQSFGEVFDNVRSGAATYGVIPLENSSIGSIVANYDLLWSHDAFIVDEIFVPVHHHLIGFEGVRLAEIREVFSHPAALDQCRKLFKQNQKMSARVHWDTSGSVAYVKESGKRELAAIAGEPAAKEYGMAIIQSNVEDYAHNSTRFGLVVKMPADPKNMPSQGLTAPYKLSLVVELAHEPGALAKILHELAHLGANLTKIESRPIAENPWHYRFFMDIEIKDAANDQPLLAALAAKADNMKLLGRYKVAEAFVSQPA
jgi:prephenate dehydratase